MARRKSRAKKESGKEEDAVEEESEEPETIEEMAPEPVEEPPKEPEPAPGPYIRQRAGEGMPPEEEPPAVAAPLVPPAPPVVEERVSTFEVQLKSMNTQRLQAIAGRHGIIVEGLGREELISAIVAERKAREAAAPPAVAAGSSAPETRPVAPKHTFLLGPGEVPRPVAAKAPSAKMEKPKVAAPRAESEPRGKKSHAFL